MTGGEYGHRQEIKPDEKLLRVIDHTEHARSRRDSRDECPQDLCPVDRVYSSFEPPRVSMKSGAVQSRFEVLVEQGGAHRKCDGHADL